MIAVLRAVCPDTREQVPLSTLTTFRIGGPCDCLCCPIGIEQTIDTLFAAAPFGGLVLGRGSNALAADAGLRQPVILMSGLNDIAFDGVTVRAGSGVSLPELARAAAKRGLSGLEWASGIPGSLGGAVVMNAGAYGGDMSQIVTSALVFDGRDAVTLTDFAFGYRHSVFCDHSGYTVLEVTLKLTHGDPSEIASRMEQYRRARNEKQPVELPSAGSFFKRPPGHFAGALVEQCGLKGASVGGARVSEKHAGFVVNTGGATCEDVIRLAALVREMVLRETGVVLEPEVRLLGDVSWGG